MAVSKALTFHPFDRSWQPTSTSASAKLSSSLASTGLLRLESDCRDSRAQSAHALGKEQNNDQIMNKMTIMMTKMTIIMTKMTIIIAEMTIIIAKMAIILVLVFSSRQPFPLR